MIGKYNQFEQKQKPTQMSKPVNEAISVGGRIVTPKTLPGDIADILDERIGDEYTAHYFYRNAANWCKNANYKKAAEFFEAEANSELEHAKGLQDYLTQWNLLPAIPSAPTKKSFESLIDIINGAYEMEYGLLEKYSGNQVESFKEHPATFNFIQKYVDIQNGAVGEYSDLLNALNLIDVNNKLDVLYFENKYFG
jgi:ferritin